MLWQIETPCSPVSLDEQLTPPCDPNIPETDAYDQTLDKLMVSEGCPNCRDDD
jgi:hypothetical protein